MSAAEVRAKAEKLESEIRRETIIGFVFASVITLAGLIGLATLRQAAPIVKVIIALVVILVWFGAWRTTVRTRSRLSQAELTTCLDFYRRELQRRRAAAVKAPRVLLVTVAIAVVQFLVVVRRYNPATGDWLPYPFALVGVVLIALPLWRRKARTLQHELDDLNKFERGAVD